MHRMQALNSRSLLEGSASCNAPDDSDTCTITDDLKTNSVYGVLQFSYDPRTNQRKQVAMNGRYAELHGYHQEEFLARFANHDLDSHHTDIDSIVLLLDSLQARGSVLDPLPDPAMPPEPPPSAPTRT